MATGTNPLGLASSDPDLDRKKNPPSGNPFTVTGRGFIPNPNLSD
jgi:hypothetical protein